MWWGWVQGGWVPNTHTTKTEPARLNGTVPVSARAAHALAEVKKGLGPDAVILHTRTYRVGGVMGVGARDMVEITASTDTGGVRNPTSNDVRNPIHIQ